MRMPEHASISDETESGGIANLAERARNGRGRFGIKVSGAVIGARDDK
jgi:hypothetical protein